MVEAGGGGDGPREADLARSRRDGVGKERVTVQTGVSGKGLQEK